MEPCNPVTLTGKRFDSAMSAIIGTCSLCGGPVEMPGMMVNPVASCRSCGAVAQHAYGPVIPMQPMPSTGTASTPKCSTCGGGYVDGLHYCTGVRTTGAKP